MRLALLLALVALLSPTALGLNLPVKVDANVAAPSAPTLEAPNLVAARGSEAQMAPDGNASYNLSFSCPPAQVTLDPTGGVSGSGAMGCPNRIVDKDDLMGNPSLAVDPVVPGKYAFASLHGQTANGPTPLARGGQTHTTFATLGLGDQWTDEPYTPPQSAFPDGGRVVGLDEDALIDEGRTLHVASLYALQQDGAWNYTIVLWKFDQESRVGSQQGLTQADYELVNAKFSSRLPGSTIDKIWLLENKDDNLVYLFWHERAPAGKSLPLKGVGNVTSWVAGASTTADAFTPWVRLPDLMLVGPCPIATNPVLVHGAITFGCEAGPEGEPLLKLAPGEIAIRTIEPSLRSVVDEGKAPLVHGEPRLAANSKGDLALVTTRVVYYNGTEPANLTLGNRTKFVDAHLRSVVVGQLALRRDGGDWSGARDFGDEIHNASRLIRAARINAILYRETSDVIHVVYVEDRVSNQSEAAAPRWAKFLVAIDPLGHVVTSVDLHTSDKGEVFGGRASSYTDPYGDTHDTLVEVSGKEYLAFGDYAVIVFAQVVERDERLPLPVQVASAPAAEALPAAEGIATATGIGLGATAAVGAGALVARRVASVHGAGRGKR